jgi:hypothetical protein
MALVIVDALIEKCPSWGYLVLLIVAFSVAVFVSGIGLKVVARIVQRVRQLTPGQS